MPNTEFVFFRFADDGEKLRIRNTNVQEVIITKIPGKLYRLLLLLRMAPPLEWLLDQNDLETVIFPNFYTWPVRNKKAKIITFVADTAFVDYPGSVPNWYFRSLLKKSVRFAVRHSSVIVTCSSASANRIVKLFGAKNSQLEVLYPGYDQYTSPPVQKRSKPYILFVGTLEPRKNVANIINAYLQLPTQLRDTHELVLAGGKGWLDNEITTLLSRHKNDGVVALGYVDDTIKNSLYKYASLFLYPSMYEGFGMPIIEAQSHGVPVVTAKNSSLPEAAGDAAIFSDTSAEGIAAAISSILSDKKLATRLSVAGKRNAARFTWEASVSCLKEIVQRD